MADPDDSNDGALSVEPIVAEEDNPSDTDTSSVVSTPATTTVAHTFTPTVAGERGIFAPWPKKVRQEKLLNIHRNPKGFLDFHKKLNQENVTDDICFRSWDYMFCWLTTVKKDLRVM